MFAIDVVNGVMQLISGNIKSIKKNHNHCNMPQLNDLY